MKWIEILVKLLGVGVLIFWLTIGILKGCAMGHIFIKKVEEKRESKIKYIQKIPFPAKILVNSYPDVHQ